MLVECFFAITFRTIAGCVVVFLTFKFTIKFSSGCGYPNPVLQALRKVQTFNITQ